MRLARQLLSSVFILSLLTSCATLSEKECRTADWQEIGLRDGQNGMPRTRAADHAAACSKVGITMNDSLYFSARADGLRQYCTPQNGLNVGLAGQRYQGVCPGSSEPAFLDQYRPAYEIYGQRRELDGMNTRRRNLEYSLVRATTDEQRQRLRNELQQLDYDMRRERDQLWILERRLSVPIYQAY